MIIHSELAFIVGIRTTVVVVAWRRAPGIVAVVVVAVVARGHTVAAVAATVGVAGSIVVVVAYVCTGSTF